MYFRKMYSYKRAGIFAVLLIIFLGACNHTKENNEVKSLWHNQTRELRYKPDGEGFVITNGNLRFNRALYGSNSGFRVEAGDLPEFALYMPRLGGTFRLGLMKGSYSKWLINADKIQTRYQAGSIAYSISDSILQDGKLFLQLLALPDADGMILKVQSEKIPDNVELFWAFGGATGKRFSRDGDLGADPESSFYLKPENCLDNEFFISEDSFHLYYGSGRSLSDNEVYENNYTPSKEELQATHLKLKKRIFGIFPSQSTLKIADAGFQESPLKLYNSESAGAPVISGKLNLNNSSENYFLLMDPDSKVRPNSSELASLFAEADSARVRLAGRIKIATPDVYINAVGASLATAADAVWDGQSFMHGAIAWRMPLNGWRGAYAADWLGWHDRAQTHFKGYFAAQYTEPPYGESVPDPETHLARQKEEIGTALFTDGYISRSPGKINKPHHYDMNLVFIAQLLSHFRWTGDLEFLKESWPVIKRHLAWEKRNFDPDDDGLYNAYCCIWASDALQYSGGGVAHSLAYNYRANKDAAELAAILGEDPTPYLAEAEKIKNAANDQLWLPNKGWYAEYKDLLGNQLVHPSAALWTIYHSIDEGLADPFQAYQMTQYVDRYIPQIPIEAEGITSNSYYTLSTTNWMPYTWSINNVALAEVLHTALAYWQSGRDDEAFKLSKSCFLDYMFLGSSPGNFGQLSYYDAFRGELYRDFADPTGMASRALIEGLFGIQPDMLNNCLSIKPGWPLEWEHASLETPDVKISFRKNGKKDNYLIKSEFRKDVKLKLVIKAKSDEIKSIKWNEKKVNYSIYVNSIGTPLLEIEDSLNDGASIEIEWGNSKLSIPAVMKAYAQGEIISLQMDDSEILDIYDPQTILRDLNVSNNSISTKLSGETGGRTFFVQLKQEQMIWWQPISFELVEPVIIQAAEEQSPENIKFTVQNNTDNSISGVLDVNGFEQKLSIPKRSQSSFITVSKEYLVPGSNVVNFDYGESKISSNIINWHILSDEESRFDKIDITESFNERVTNIFNEQYYSPRSPYPTLCIPVQGIGDWCSYRETEEIDDAGLRQLAGEKNTIISPQGIPFYTPGKETENILFTSKWDNYPDSAKIPISGKASHAYLLMAGSVHHMQINMENAILNVNYQDGSKDVLPIISPDNWWPIEQDYYQDGYAFKVDGVQPPRLYLKTGEWHLGSYDILRKNGTNKIEGGAASLLDLPLNPTKELKSLSLETKTNDLVIGIMAVTLKR